MTSSDEAVAYYTSNKVAAIYLSYLPVRSERQLGVKYRSESSD